MIDDDDTDESEAIFDSRVGLDEAIITLFIFAFAVMFATCSARDHAVRDLGAQPPPPSRCEVARTDAKGVVTLLCP